LEAFPDVKLTGKVSRVGTLATTSPMRPFDDKRFDLIIAIDPTSAELRPDMTARADVIVGSRPDVLMVPVTAVFNHQGTRVVYVVGAGGTEARRVDLGQSNDRMVEIVAGLQAGERVSLLPPATAPAPAAAAGTPAGGDARQAR
ncbi:MAG TPA: hypothetical protein VEA16_00560, partial [Vicinamibacterales bacterium]|nr:hypothetical protein [Vicinamibacterales bacterium]